MISDRRHDRRGAKSDPCVPATFVAETWVSLSWVNLNNPPSVPKNSFDPKVIWSEVDPVRGTLLIGPIGALCCAHGLKL